MKSIFAFAALLALFAGMASATLYVNSYSVSPSTLNTGQEGAVTFAIQNAIPTGSTTTTQLENVQVFFGGAEGVNRRRIVEAAANLLAGPERFGHFKEKTYFCASRRGGSDRD